MGGECAGEYMEWVMCQCGNEDMVWEDMCDGEGMVGWLKCGGEAMG